ncbi:small integral membrane protein 34 isoform X2 [Psammomys obesus]|uniref:small integral membrane protein 34 isoform X2 n=1 Tax=Psammomys obesus TaxID=48139 RepID=UPI002452A843|nr:small integral membrane protein 34 isoform X2 [Psammomys obesus]XP_055470970.1 small integral membrane protein 34 isoform X2 [Psammomys obesus]
MYEGTHEDQKRAWILELATGTIKWTPQEAFNHTQPSSPLPDSMVERNGSISTRILRTLDATSAAWYILTIIGIYGLLFIFQLASNILRRNERSLEDIYYSNLTSELKRKGLQSRVVECSPLTLSNAAALEPKLALMLASSFLRTMSLLLSCHTFCHLPLCLSLYTSVFPLSSLKHHTHTPAHVYNSICIYTDSLNIYVYVQTYPWCICIYTHTHTP